MGPEARRVGVIGGGTMGEALTRALIANRIRTVEEITVCEVDGARRARLAASLGVHVSETAKAAAAGAPVLFLAVKPQDFPAVGEALQGRLEPAQLVVSIMAGVPLQALRDGLGHRAVVRAMPNTPAQIGQGMTVWTAPDEVSAAQREAVQECLSAMGKEIRVADERQIDMATAVSGSGPAYVFVLLEAMIDAAVQIGLKRELAVEMVYQTALGAVAFARDSGLHPAVLRDMVTSPGGTTAAGLRAMEEHGMRAGMMGAVDAAYRRALELGR